jgi:hypothetical protein
MFRYVSWKRWGGAALVACILAPVACAHGVEADFDPREGEGGSFTGTTGGAGVTSVSTVGIGGASVTSGGGTAGSTGEGGSTASTSASGGASGSATAGGSAGSSGAAGAGGSAGGASGMPDAGQAGAGIGGASGSGAGGGASGAGGTSAGAGGASGGKVDAGVDSGPICPAGVSVSGQNATPGHGARDITDVLYTDTCPQGQVTIGYTGYVDTRAPASVGRIQTLCGTLSVTSTGSCQVTATPQAPLPMRGTVGTLMFDETCPANQVVVGFQGRSSVVLDQVGFLCAPLTISRAGTRYTLAIGSTTATPRAGGTGGTAFVEPCPDGQIARGTNVTIYGGFVGAFGLICGTPALP